MLYPAFFDDDFFDDFDRAFAPQKNPLYGRHAKNMMKTDIRETDDAYLLDLELPGFRKDEINVRLENGYLTISAEKAVEADAGKTAGKVLRKERYEGSLERSFYVGESVRPEEISASYENGVLQLSVPKRTARKDPEKKTIEIQ
ncbi:MAG: Hsp20/alpha crystallin family protein [Lachnospiraceae bacterium]|jgi:HSP20 family protein|nr:Hsp20/alpha crystallin family protein [Lachnospiraceae bacterium]MCI1398449.1 Hsp20/alpha crystallin family protein [Lachnospiraceae bacterium]MCI1424045.1 Hsp20/alpha crystallin family protein [Lachnospiraceae bacterium]MCI1452844.1 Hsp20/alpha crystallin family protein [Lachnospiraceae bacterium]MDD5848593.1 Hsp20/alpha crystallin family protein [Bacillota bacterium]